MGLQRFLGRGHGTALPQFLCHACRVVSPVEILEEESGGKVRRRHAAASCRVCGRVDGVKFPSKTEAAVYQELVTEFGSTHRIYRQVTFPLLNLAPSPPVDSAAGRPLTFSVDFVLVDEATGEWRVIDAKARAWKSREWARGAAAFEACWGLRVETRSPAPYNRRR